MRDQCNRPAIVACRKCSPVDELDREMTSWLVRPRSHTAGDIQIADSVAKPAADFEYAEKSRIVVDSLTPLRIIVLR